DVRTRAADGTFAAVEHVCHLRDIEEEGYVVRIGQLLTEAAPVLRDLDGARLAEERRYLDQDPASALRAFALARERSMALLRAATPADFQREGMFENVGKVTLERLVAMMREHDEGHLRELSLLASR